MSKRTNEEFLSDIQGGMTYESFLADTKTQDAVIRNLEVIGEATKNLSEELRLEYAEVPWRSMAGVRNRLIHHYFGVNLDIIWQIATAELPGVASQLDRILADYK